MGWLRRNFRIPADWEQKRILLHFEAVAGDCVIQVNGKEICRNFDAHLPFEADITAYVNREGENELLVGVRDTKLFDKSHPVYQKWERLILPVPILIIYWVSGRMYICLLCLRYGLRMYLYNRG